MEPKRRLRDADAAPRAEDEDPECVLSVSFCLLLLHGWVATDSAAGGQGLLTNKSIVLVLMVYFFCTSQKIPMLFPSARLLLDRPFREGDP